MDSPALSEPAVIAVSLNPRHRFSKQPVDLVDLVAGLGVAGDAHAGQTVQHLSRKRWRPDLPNLRQVHLLHGELLDALRAQGFPVAPGDVGENITTRGLDLLALPTGTRLHLGASAVVELTGLRNPCVQLDRFADGLMKAVLRKEPDGTIVRLAGVMSVVVEGGPVQAGDTIAVRLPTSGGPPLAPV